MTGNSGAEDREWMAEAVQLGRSVRTSTSPNPWVGAVVVPEGDQPVALGATQPPGGPHAEVVALELAGSSARGATLYVTLEPCSHQGRTGPCADALISAGVGRVVVGVVDPDPNVSGTGIERLRRAGIEVDVGVGAAEVEASLAPYLAHRRTGRPWVVLKLAATLDGRIAAPDGTSKWITGPEARADVQQLRAESDAILVGAGTVRADDPALTARLEGARNPLRVVLGEAAPDARAQPELVHRGPLEPLLLELGERGVIQLLVEGGAGVAGSFHRAGLVDQYVLYFAPAFMGGDDGLGLFSGPGAATMAEVWRGRISDVRRIGPDLRVDVLAGRGGSAVP
ncbi:MAG TPA: bifunctional diaminohydroxyphosphoribosylaminopyrimidine deaminase/5-amino-6-(5-phosphoribosylamino)uracil reductase RibD [Acidimicrobiales bacterium]|nr:bifunctional diaminohydroxyphosphoribosylaminopyrimidine deaminase/5-amino-6-(5-phosphoribosylamino)uracil reductase RibD [Acidimicrobiales bacterium]